jgi:hypothetical protein
MYFRPVIVTDVVDKWPAMNWSKDFFIQNYGKEKVMVIAAYHFTLELV